LDIFCIRFENPIAFCFISPVSSAQAVVLLTMDDTSARFAASAAGPLLVELLRLHGARNRQAAFWLLQVCGSSCARVCVHSLSLPWIGR
jgi:hypothetical protein